MTKQTFIKAIILFIFIFTFKSQVSLCKPFVYFENNQNFTLNPSFTLDSLTVPYWPNDIAGADYIDGTLYNRFYNVKIAEKEETEPLITIDEVQGREFTLRREFYDYADIIKKGELSLVKSEIGTINQELRILKEVGRKYPLYHTQFLDCAKSELETEYRSKTAVLFFEKLDNNFDTFVLRKLLEDKGIKHYVEMFLMMAIALKNLHLEGYSHNNLQSKSFFYKQSNPPIVKLGDFGFVNLPGIQFDEGNVDYFAPEIKKNNDIRSRTNDIYSLGIVYYVAIYGPFGSVLYSNGLQFQFDALRNKMYRERPTQMGYEFTRKIKKLEQEGNENDKAVLEELNQIILDLIKSNPEERLNLIDLISRLEKLLNSYEENSIYLEINKDQLLAAAYPEYENDKAMFGVNITKPIVKPTSKPKKENTSFITMILGKCASTSQKVDVNKSKATERDPLGKTYSFLKTDAIELSGSKKKLFL